MEGLRIRRAQEKDIPRVEELLSQVLEIHAAIRPDIFLPGTTKYTQEELSRIFQDEETPVFVAVDEADEVMGYAFCIWHRATPSNNVIPHDEIYIDDLCVDGRFRGRHVGEALFAHVKEEARRAGCRVITLNVWEGNESALRFYEKMGLRPRKTFMEMTL